jgi:hypothetical protein
LANDHRLLSVFEGSVGFQRRSPSTSIIPF